MKKPHNNMIRKQIFALVVGTALLIGPLPLAAHPEDELLLSYCTRLLVFEVETEKKIDVIESAYSARESARVAQLAQIRAKQDKALEESREKTAEVLQDTLQGINEAVDDTERIEAARQDISSAKSEYDAAVSSAVFAYRNGINEAMESRKAVLATGKRAFENSVGAILDKAEVDCKARTDVKVIFENTTTNLKKAHEDFKMVIRSLQPVDGTLADLSDTRDTMIGEAQATLKSEVLAAIAELELN